MIASHSPTSTAAPPTNRILKALSIHGRDYKTFGENIILLLNRESETSLQLLILKLLYLLHTTPSTYEYFYTNDLYVLADILVRNLLDLPAAAAAPLQHTYLRVLHPLLANTQLKHPPHYKRAELRKALAVLAADTAHFDAPDPTTLRLVHRCLDIPWLAHPDIRIDLADADAEEAPSTSGAAVVARRALLGVGALPAARASSLSVAEMATQKETPGVEAPSKRRERGDDDDAAQSPFADGGAA